MPYHSCPKEQALKSIVQNSTNLEYEVIFYSKVIKHLQVIAVALIAILLKFHPVFASNYNGSNIHELSWSSQYKMILSQWGFFYNGVGVTRSTCMGKQIHWIITQKFSVIVKTLHVFVLRPSYHRAEAKRFPLKEIILSITLS